LNHGCMVHYRILDYSVRCFFYFKIYFVYAVFRHVNKDILDRALHEPSAKPRLLDGSVTNEQSVSQLQDLLPPVMSSCESMATAVSMAERALTQSSEIRRDLDAFLLSEAKS